MNKTFQEQMAFGSIAEKHIAIWLRRRCGYSIMPVYEKEIDSGKGPQVFAPDREIVAPDMLAIKGDETKWVEAKRKTVFTWHRRTGRWVTGIDRRHYLEYQEIAKRYPWPVYLLFLHESGQPDSRDISHGCPPTCPTGLFAGELAELTNNENHQHANWGNDGMVYWASDSLKQIATLEEVESSVTAHRKEACERIRDMEIPL